MSFLKVQVDIVIAFSNKWYITFLQNLTLRGLELKTPLISLIIWGCWPIGKLVTDESKTDNIDLQYFCIATLHQKEKLTNLQFYLKMLNMDQFLLNCTSYETFWIYWSNFVCAFSSRCRHELFLKRLFLWYLCR